MMKRLILTLLTTLLLSSFGARAGPYEDGIAAYLRGDYATAMGMLRSLAEQGNAGAQSTLGLMYDIGHGVVQDSAEAAKWYRLAAAQGDKSAQYNLGGMYDSGQGVTQDYVRAYMWFDINVASGNEAAAEDRDAVARKMTPRQIAKAQMMAHECQQQKFNGCD